MIGKAGERDRRIYTVQPIDDGAIGNEKAGSGSIDVDPAGRGPREPQVIRSDRRSYARRGFVLRQVVRLEPRDNDLRDIRFGKRRDIVGAQAIPFDSFIVPIFTEWPRRAPSASASGTGPNLTWPPPPAGSRRDAAAPR